MKAGKVSKVINIAPYEYIHVRDVNESLVKVVTGPKTYIVQENEELVGGQTPQKMVVISPMHYICIKNPVILKEDGTPEREKHGQPKLAFAEIEYRFQEDYKTPFFLYYGEVVQGKIEKLKFVKTNEALVLSALRNFTDCDSVERKNGDSWLYKGPKIFYPRPEIKEVRKEEAIILNPCSALKLKATQNFTGEDGDTHKAGEEWLVRKPGAYIKGVYETLVKLQRPILINDRQAIHLRAIKAFKDFYGKDHKAGEEWILTPDITTWHIIDIFEEQVNLLNMIVLSKDQYSVILNPIGPDGKNQKGSKKLMKGQKTFFLQPGEELESGIQNIMILNENEAVLLQAKESFKDENEESRVPGDKWMIKGPCRFLPPIEVEIVEKRSVIPLDDKEGIYVRDTKTGNLRAHIGKSYLLEANEELWSNELSEIEEQILEKANPEVGKRDKTKIVSYKCPYNQVMQIFNYKSEKSRIVFGPDLILLEPDEKFCLMFLSGKTPKVPGVIKTLSLNMGPTYTTDRIEVETSDHALLVIEVAYNWFFDVDKNNEEECKKIFAVRDCIGEMCSLMAGRVRGAVAEMTLNDFHKNSAKVIRKAVMGATDGKINDKYLFTNNLLAISNVDIKNIDTKNKDIKDKLQKTVNLAIESSTKSQLEEANRAAESSDQVAKALLRRNIIEDNSKSMEFQKVLYEKKTKTKSMEEQGPKEAQAKAEASKMFIESNSKIKIARNNTELQKLKNQFKNEIEKLEHLVKIEHEKGINDSEIAKKSQISEIETKKFNNIIDAIGKETLIDISQAGPEAQVKLLQSLGLSGFIMTDGNSPINLFNFANNIAKK